MSLTKLDIRPIPDPKATFAGNLANRLLSLPIVRGPLRGSWWTLRSRGKLARVLLGSYEPHQTAAFLQVIRPGDVVFDVGAHTGYYSVLSSRLVGKHGRVVAFEPAPKNAASLRYHVACNRLENITIYQAAAGDVSASAKFRQGRGTGMGRIADDGELRVTMVTVDDVVRREQVYPTHIKIDVERAELRVLLGARQTLLHSRPTLFLSTHGTELHAECLKLLRALDYDLRPMTGDHLETTNQVICVPRSLAARQAA